MKSFKIFVPVFIIAVLLFCSIQPVITKSEDISSKVFRLHIIANSNSVTDQELKLKVRDNVLKQTEYLYRDCKTSAQAKKITEMNLNVIKKTAQNTVAFNGYDYPVYAYTSKEYFNTRKYDSFTLPAGEYDCLKIIIGKGKGKNWWCVMFPTVCISGCTDDFDTALTEDEKKMIESRGYAVRFKAAEIYEYIKSKTHKQ